MGKDKSYRYSVIYTQALKQFEVYRVIRKAMPEGRGTVFYPCAELWWNDTVDTVIRPLFPGYVFIRSDMNREELHDMLRQRRREILSFVKELKLGERKVAGEPLYEKEEEVLIDLKDDEAEFFDFLLNFRYEPGEKEAAGEEKGSGDDFQTEAYGEPRDEDELMKGRLRTTKIPVEGVIGMSRGYCENGRYVVMEGPLKGHEERIVDVDLRKRKAYLNIKINGHIAKAGLEIYGKKYWYPKDKYASEVLADGTSVDPKGIAEAMMSGRD